MKRIHDMSFGSRRTERGGGLFRLWAPSAKRVDLVLSTGPDAGDHAMEAQADGWYELKLPTAEVGLRYGFKIDGGTVVPDPASRSNPEDVHAPSALVEPTAFDWPDRDWRGRPWSDAIIYELHIGCFTPEGTFTAAIQRLDDLVKLGVTVVELMPVAEFAGARGWGYDGVLQFAPESSYGTPDDLKRLVVAAHDRGLMVFMDVVYNHFGPDGNYLHAFAEPFFNETVHTPWGPAINFDGKHSRTVRDFFIDNAMYWIEEFHMDGLRIDAVHAMHDDSKLHFIDELTQTVRSGPGHQRHVHIVLENGINDAVRLPRDESGRPLLADAQWNDDVHHAMHVILTSEIDGYYVDYGKEPVRLFARALAEGYGFQGDISEYEGEARGTPSVHLPPIAFVNSTQTHDQVGNRAFGDRIHSLAAESDNTEALHTMIACVLLAPSIPMLFMGEEYAASTPFQYFCDFHGELAAAVTKGRREEFGRFERFSDPAVRHSIPDPNDAKTFENSKLDWTERADPQHAKYLDLYTKLLKLRHEHLMPCLGGGKSGKFTATPDGTIRITWPLADGVRWHMAARLGAEADPDAGAAELPGKLVYRSHPDAAGLSPWSVIITSEEA